MNDEQEKHAKIALWLGYRQNTDNLSVWHMPNARGYKERQGFYGPPDFINNPAHYERIKAKLRGLGIHYKLDYTPDLTRDLRHCISFCGGGIAGECAGSSESEILLAAALNAIKRGL